MKFEEIVKEPNKYFEKLGFNEFDEETSDSTRWTWFRKFLFRIDNLNAIIELRFCLTIEDDPSVRYSDNLYYSFDHCQLIFTEREIDFRGHLSGNEQFYTVEKNLKIFTTAQLKSFLSINENLQNFI